MASVCSASRGDVRISAIVEWKGGQTGWRVQARLKDGREINIKNGHTLLAARRRLRRALDAAGIREAEVSEELRIPVALTKEITELNALRQRVEREHTDFMRKRTELAQRLLTELAVTEKEVAEWFGISSTRLAKVLQDHATDTTGERRVKAAP